MAGTTGYDFLNHVNQLFVDAGQRDARCGPATPASPASRRDYAEIVHAAKLQVMRDDLAAEVERLTGLLAEVCESHRRQRDHTRRELRDALREVIAAFRCLPHLRPPRAPGHGRGPGARGRGRGRGSGQRRPDIDAELLDFIGELLTGGYPGAGRGRLRACTSPR